MRIEMMNNENSALFSAEQKNDFIKAMKIGYFKEFFKQGLISAEQLEYLIALQENTPLEIAA